MYRGKYEPEHFKNSKSSQGVQKRIRRRNKAAALLLSVMLIVTIAIGGTIAWLSANTDPVQNTFLASRVSCAVTENFDGTYKKDVNVTNTGDIDAYIRVKLVSYRVNEAGQHIGGTAEIPAFTPGDGWVKNGDHYYYTMPVKPNGQPEAKLIENIPLTGSYSDADGGKQVIEVMAEAIQAKGTAEDQTKAVVKAWGIDPETLD